MFLDLSLLDVTLVASAFFFADLCKGVAGIGIPIITVPVIASLADIVVAII